MKRLDMTDLFVMKHKNMFRNVIKKINNKELNYA
jgi:hypothetical protein